MITAIALPRFIKSKFACAVIDIIMLVLFAVTAAGRVLSDMHWLSDVIAGAVFALIFAFIYFVIVKLTTKKEQNE